MGRKIFRKIINLTIRTLWKAFPTHKEEAQSMQGVGWVGLCANPAVTSLIRKSSARLAISMMRRPPADPATSDLWSDLPPPSVLTHRTQSYLITTIK